MKLGGDPSSSFCFQGSPLPWMNHETLGDIGAYKSACLKLSDKYRSWEKISSKEFSQNFHEGMMWRFLIKMCCI